MSEFKTIYIHTFGDTWPTLKRRAEMRKVCGPYQWRPQEITPYMRERGRGFYQSSKGLYVGDSTFELRLIDANELLPSYARHITGYYTDEHGDGDTIKPIVARLNHNRGFLVGWTMGKGMCASLDLSHIYTNEEDAARAAHQDAEYQAEREREYQFEASQLEANND